MNAASASRAEAVLRQEHGAAVQLLASADSQGLQAALQDLRHLLLSTDPGALRRSVGFWGRLIGRDIHLDAEARALRERSGVLLHRAEAEAALLRGQHAGLSAQAARLRTASAGMETEMTTLAAGEGEQVHERRIAHLATLRRACALTIAQLELVAANALAIADRHAEQLPRLALLLDQQRGLQAGKQHALQLSSVQDTLDDLQASLAILPRPASPDTHPSAPPAKENP